MRSRLTRAVIPVIGLLAVAGAFALVATAPVVLFSPSNEAGALPSAPAASSEVARVTAPSLQPQRPASRATANKTREAQARTSASGQLATTSPIGGAGEATTDETAPPPSARPDGPAAEEPATPEDPGKASCNRKGKGKGWAKGHCKPKHHGKAKGHSKSQSRGVVALAPRGARADHVGSSRAGKHPGRSARPHSRARR
jgi:cytoskeletal protein RodZ